MERERAALVRQLNVCLPVDCECKTELKQSSLCWGITFLRIFDANKLNAQIG